VVPVADVMPVTLIFIEMHGFGIRIYEIGFHGLAALVFLLFFARKRVGTYFSVGTKASQLVL
jgi:hypothetical protein